MQAAGHWLLIALALLVLVGSWFGNFNRRHVSHPGWPAHARFHVVTYALMNVGAAVLCLWLLIEAPFPPSRTSYQLAVGILCWCSIVPPVSALVPGVSASADDER